MFKVGYLEAKDEWGFLNRPNETYAVNYQKNFRLVEHIFERNYERDPNFSLAAVAKTVDQEAEKLHSLMGAE